MHAFEEGVLKYLHASALNDLLDGAFAGPSTIEARVETLFCALQKHCPNGVAPISRMTKLMLGVGSDFPRWAAAKLGNQRL